ncbi:hypothetical protein C834K_0634 [Chlamydia poikilotherma]|uniref:Transmembrane protein n=1 Tax=Chlamydia poikilotherma TaxID=1967783 RepID=A0A3B0QGV9_9CHLA|nr:hypothetical protein [Chlamydia poikilotherma]SYX09084.1 hypothetical protein C834K_0634 [Chlamydia poikilotherma]
MSIFLANGDTNQTLLQWLSFSPASPASPASPLSPEAKGPRSSLTTQQALLDTVEGEISSMEQTDLKKMRLYKIALVILTVIGMAILFVLPVAMVFNVSIWIPIVITLGVSLISAAVTNKLRSRCEEIRLKYRSLQVYRRHLFSKHPDLKSSTLSKYHVELPKGGSLKEKLLAQLRPDMHQNSFDGGASLDQNLGLSGEINSRYQCEALLGVDNVNDAAWQKRLTDVLNAKVELLKNNSAYAALRGLSNSALRETGVDLPTLLPGMDFIDLAKSLMSICGFGNKIGLEIRQSIDQYERTYLHSKTLSSWLCEVSPATQLYLSQERQTIDVSLDMFTKLQTHINQVQFADWLMQFETWKTDVCTLAANPADPDLHKKIVAGANKLNIHEGMDKPRQAMVRSILIQLEAIITEHQSGNSVDVNRMNANLQESIKIEFKKMCKSLGNKHAKPADLLNKAEQKFIGYLSSLGNLSPLFDKIYKCIQLGKFVRMDMEKAIQKHPDNQRIRILSSIDQLLNLVNRDSWGAVSAKSVEEILKEKHEIKQDLEKARQQVDQWSEKYNNFKAQKMSRVLMNDFSESYSTIESEIDKLSKTHHQASDVEDFIDGCRRFLDTTYGALGGSQNLPTKEEITAWSEEFKTLINELESVIPNIQAIGQRIQTEGTSGKSMLLQAITSKESSLKAASKKKTAELTAAIKGQPSGSHESITTLLDDGIVQIEALCGGMRELEKSLNDPDKIVVEEVIRASNHLFSVMHSPKSTKLGDLEKLLSVRSEGIAHTSATEQREAAESTTQTVRDAQKVGKSFWETRNKDLDSFLKQVQKIASKWNMGQSIVMFVAGLILLIVSLSLLSFQMVWLPIGISAVALVLQLIPMFFNHIIEKKTFDVRAASLAKDMLPSTKILASEFDNPDVQRLSQIQDILQLEGYEQAWARGIIKDLDGSPIDKKDDFKKSIKELKSSSKSLDKSIKKRFGTTDLQSVIDRKKSASEAAQEIQPDTSSQPGRDSAINRVVTKPSDPAREASIAARQHRLDQITMEISRIEQEENKIVDYRLRYSVEMTRYEQESAYCKRLRKQFDDAKAQFSVLEKNLVESQGMVDICTQALSQVPAAQTDPQEIKAKLDLLTQLMFKIHNPNTSPNDVQEAKREFDNVVKEAADRGNLQDLRDALEVSACLGNNDVRLDQTRRDRLSRLELARAASLSGEDAGSQRPHFISERSIVGEQELEVRKRVLDFLGVNYISPFLEFSSSTIHGKGSSMAQDALKELKLLKLKIDSGDEISSEEYKKAKRLLSSYLDLERQVSPLAYGTLLGDENFIKSAQMMREKQSLQEIVGINITLGRHYLCSLAIKRMHKWINKKVEKTENKNLISNVLEVIRACDSSSSSDNQENLPDLYGKLVKLPKYILMRVIKNFKVQALLTTQKIQDVKETQKQFIKVSSVVEEKDKMFAQNRAAWEGELRNLSQVLQDLQIRKQQLVQEKATLRDRLFSDEIDN